MNWQIADQGTSGFASGRAANTYIRDNTRREGGWRREAQEAMRIIKILRSMEISKCSQIAQKHERFLKFRRPIFYRLEFNSSILHG